MVKKTTGVQQQQRKTVNLLEITTGIGGSLISNLQAGKHMEE
jgi:hypothetical protein